MTPVVDRLAGDTVVALDHPGMLGDDLALGGYDQMVRIDAQAHGAVGEGGRDAIAVALKVDEAGRRHPLGMFDETIESRWRGHKAGAFLLPSFGYRHARLL